MYDVCRTDTANTVTLHEGKLARNGRQLSMTHRQYALDHGNDSTMDSLILNQNNYQMNLQVFSSKASNNDVCSVCVEPLLSWVLTPMAGHRATLLCFGQTGTGCQICTILLFIVVDTCIHTYIFTHTYIHTLGMYYLL